ncbi:hypothetical protein EDI_182930 [Entamoeba dispar SAW760]|uniref:Uncharacterized protein n=1 Tax=Entamoeba dispar (strain ATCC PRA-260 / SAW760) TaxID=370354 RepID=B0EUQ6_ENTDS|nr:uncharacterized protein EDI_182930 [Entamoeba dispar SAW760]EDR21738.1 hypothetical protein EDI_182930 [Entamoeba dispar SAW760]|eukprot:EDR21738.1 hypothetical protein EDI_182930 [Entamoeba dispar SAW760]
MTIYLYLVLHHLRNKIKILLVILKLNVSFNLRHCNKKITECLIFDFILRIIIYRKTTISLPYRFITFFQFLFFYFHYSVISDTTYLFLSSLFLLSLYLLLIYFFFYFFYIVSLMLSSTIKQ